jgi:hypothetical protein
LASWIAADGIANRPGGGIECHGCGSNGHLQTCISLHGNPDEEGSAHHLQRYPLAGVPPFFFGCEVIMVEHFLSCPTSLPSQYTSHLTDPLSAGARVFHAATASASVPKTGVATVSHFGQNTCQPGADVEGLSILALLPQNGHFRRSATKEAYQESGAFSRILTGGVPEGAEPALIGGMTQLSYDAVRMFWLSIGNLV